MNKIWFVIIIPLLLFSCIGRHQSDVQKTVAATAKTQKKQAPKSDTLIVDLTQSSVQWKGTKMRGAGKHEGQIQLQAAYFLSQADQITGGAFVTDMTSIEVTDIPTHEPVPRNNLNNHLKSEDFFDTQQYPTAQFVLTDVRHLTKDSLHIAGNFTIKDVTKNIQFTALHKENLLTTQFTFDRFQWNIAYAGSWADKTLVDKEVELRIKLKTK